MMQADGHERRVLVLTPTGKDAALTTRALRRAGIDAVACPDIDALRTSADDGAAALLLAEEAIGAHAPLNEFIATQPPWSDLPVLVLTRSGADSPVVAQAIKDFGNVTLLERPIRTAALVSAVRAALRARDRQYQIRTYIESTRRSEEALREADRRKDEFLATLSHELRNPLAPIRNSLHILQLTSGTDPSTDRVREMMERQVNHMVRLIDDLMEVSRITRGKIDLRREYLDLSKVILGAVETSRPLMEAADQSLTVEMPPDALVLYADPVRLTEVFANLLNNAAKYSDHPGEIQLRVRRDGTGVVVSVRDSGIGIETDKLGKIFDMFMQGDGHHRRGQGGLGIGLTLVRSLVQMHGGHVKAYSEGPGTGSEFVVRLPLAAGVREAETADTTPWRDARLGMRRVLVVDDNRDAAESLGLLLRHLGAEVRVANDGASALELVDSYRPEIALLDIGMPGMDGYELARRIRHGSHNREMVLIALTGWGQEEDRRRSRRAGFDHHLIKPTDMTTLQELMRSLDEPGQSN